MARIPKGKINSSVPKSACITPINVTRLDPRVAPAEATSAVARYTVSPPPALLLSECFAESPCRCKDSGDGALIFSSTRPFLFASALDSSPVLAPADLAFAQFFLVIKCVAVRFLHLLSLINRVNSFLHKWIARGPCPIRRCSSKKKLPSHTHSNEWCMQKNFRRTQL